jgi:hypothetical protein
LDQLGAGVVDAGEREWMFSFDLVARRAKFIVAVPIVPPGTVWEVERLVKSELIKKTAFIVPDPRTRNRKNRNHHEDNSFQRLWLYSQYQFASREIRLPSVPLGSIFLNLAGSDNVEEWYSAKISRSSLVALCDFLTGTNKRLDFLRRYGYERAAAALDFRSISGEELLILRENLPTPDAN